MVRLIACGCFAIVLCFATLMVPSCSGSDSGAGTRDGGGGGIDAGPDGGLDAGSDAGPDGGPDGGPDAGPDGGPDGGPDAGPPCPAADTSCATFEDHTEPGDGRTITFGFVPEPRFSPACMRIARTQTVTFEGSFSLHPLRQDCGPTAAIAATDVGLTASFTFNTAGIYGYYCANHRGFGMVGAIQVVP